MEAQQDRGGSTRTASAPRRPGRYFVVWLVLVLLAGGLLYAEQLREARAAFDARADAVHRQVEARLEANEIVIAGLAAYLSLSAVADHAALQAYSERFLDGFPQIDQIALHRRLARTDVPRLVAEMRRRGLPNFKLRQFDFDGERRSRPAADKGAYLVTVARSSPRNSNGLALGQDVEASKLLRLAVARALESRGAAASGLFQLPDGQWAYTLFRPVYPPQDSRYSQLLVSLLVRVEGLLPPAAELPADFSVRLDQAFDAAPAWMLQGAPASSVLERRVFPRLRVVRGFDAEAQPFELSVERQLGFALIDPWLTAGYALAAGLALLVALRYGDDRARRDAERQTAERKLYRLANFDSLTGLPNRNLFSDRLRQALSRGRRRQTRVALFFLDLDGFKAVNDSAGHAAGDRLLQLVSERLLRAVREQDTVARLSGDEFVVLLEDVHHRDDAERVMQQLHAGFIESFRIDSFEFMVSASIGLALYPDDGEQAEQLLHSADQRMYALKHPEWVGATSGVRAEDL